MLGFVLNGRVSSRRFDVVVLVVVFATGLFLLAHPGCLLRMLIDTHCHYNHDAFDEDRAEAVARARAAGVARAVVIGYDLASSEWAIRLAEEFDELSAAVGIHPNDAAEATAVGLTRLEELAAHPKVVALVRSGSTFTGISSPAISRTRSFVTSSGSPVDLTSPSSCIRESQIEQVVATLEAEGATWSGILHCFSGDPDVGRRAVALGLHLGLGGVLTFKNARQLQETAGFFR